EACAIPAQLNVAIYCRSQRRNGTLASRAGLDLGRAWNVSAADRALIELLLGCTPAILRMSDRRYQPRALLEREDTEEPGFLTGASIHPSAAARVLPALCASDRLVRASDHAPLASPLPDDAPRTPLRWDGDAPFAARLRARSARRGIALQL